MNQQNQILYIKISPTFRRAATATTNPHDRVDKGIALVSRLQGDMNAIFIGGWVDGIGHGRVREFFQNILCARHPAGGLCDDERRRIIRGL